jgi:CubicO group peptidase (beta-lactamase class C family)
MTLLKTTARMIGVALLLFAMARASAAEDMADAVQAYLRDAVPAETANGRIVVGIVDERGSRVVGFGTADNGTNRPVDGDTVFEIGSTTKTFTGLLLQDMIRRGDMKLDDPVQNYLPASVRMPARGRHAITLRHLATHTAGLPRIPDNLNPKRASLDWGDYTVEQMYAFLSRYQLTRDPGVQYEYSNLGVALLGHLVARKAGMDYETLLVDRICRPLGMDSTRITLTPELKPRFAVGHNEWGYPVPAYDMPVDVAGCGGLRSTANDLLKYVSANLGLTQSDLTPAMEQMHVRLFTAPDIGVGMIWRLRDLHGTQLVEHTGGTNGFIAFCGFDKARRRGVVILSNSLTVYAGRLNDVLLESEWQSDRRPTPAKSAGGDYDRYVGRYVPAGRPSEPGVGIRRDGDRLFAQAEVSGALPAEDVVPPVIAELLPQSDGRFFERVSGRAVQFSRGALTIAYRGNAVSFEKVFDNPPKTPEPPKLRVPVKLDSKALDAVVGRYEVAAGANVTIWREGGGLLGKVTGGHAVEGAFGIYPESDTRFFLKYDGSVLTFSKNGDNQVTSVVHHSSHAGVPDVEARKRD